VEASGPVTEVMTPILISAGAGLPAGGAAGEVGAAVVAGGGAVVTGGADVFAGGAAVVTGAEVVGEDGADEQLTKIKLEINRIPSMTQRILFTKLPPLINYFP
jgi:hypothetical protein